jgi:hypothetical protein
MNAAARVEKIETTMAASATETIPDPVNEDSATHQQGQAFAIATLTIGGLSTLAWIFFLTWLPGKAFGLW